MALQELSKTEMAALIAGATAVNAIIGRVAVEEPDELPVDQIHQWEIAALWHVEAIKDALALGFRRRLAAGATVQPGPYTLEPDSDTMEDLEDKQAAGGADFNCVGFNDVGYDPTKGPEAKAKPAKKVAKRWEPRRER